MYTVKFLIVDDAVLCFLSSTWEINEKRTISKASGFSFISQMSFLSSPHTDRGVRRAGGRQG